MNGRVRALAWAAAMNRRLLRLLAPLVAAAIGLVFAAFATEHALRFADPIGLNYDVEFSRYRNEALRFDWEGKDPASIDLEGRLFRHKEKLDLDLGSFRMRTNAIGFRGPEIEAKREGGPFRVLVLGDSVAFGWGVDEQVTFLRRFESEWNAAQPTKPIEVCNAGHLVYDTTQQLALLRELGPTLAPDLVLLVYVVNDIEPSRDIVEENLLGKRPDPSEAVPDAGDAWTAFAAMLRDVGMTATAELCALQSDPVARFRKAAGSDATYEPHLYGKGKRGWPRSQIALLAMRDWCKERSIPFFVLDHTRPVLKPLPGFCADSGIACEDLRFTDEELPLPMYNSKKDTHANAFGHELLLQKLQRIAERLPIPR